MRDLLDLPSTFTLDACRHGGMTELEAAELTDGQGRALSGHRCQRAYRVRKAHPGTAPCPLLASAMPIALRTRQGRTFRMSHGKTFRMTTLLETRAALSS